MKTPQQSKPSWVNFIVIIAFVFGGLTLFSGGSVLFLDGQARADAGDYVPFILWFNFIAGFFYIAASMGIFTWKKWGVTLSWLIFITTIIAFIGLAGHIITGGNFEIRTVVAMVLRTSVWLVIALVVGKAWKNYTAPNIKS